MHKKGKESERSRLRSREEEAAADECKDHLRSGVSHRQVINDEVLIEREYQHLMKVYP